MFTDRNRAVRERQMSHDLYRSGLDHYSGEYDETAMSQWVNQLAGQPTVSPWINVTDDARQSTYSAFMEDNYNPFIGNEGAWVTPEGNDIRGSNNGTAEGYRDDSISAYLKNAFAGQDQVKNRADALRSFKKWNGTEQGINTASTRMNQRYFNELGLGDFGLEFVDPRQEAYDKMVAGFSSGESTGGFMDAYNSQRPVNPAGLATGGARPSSPMDTPVHSVDVFPNESMGGNHFDPFKEPQVKPGGFMESYLKKKAENKPSVMSLMTELKDA